MLASLPMYDLPGLRGDWARLWARLAPALRAEGVPAPQSLYRPRDLLRHWQDSRLVLSQSCGRPYRLHLAGRVAVIGAFDFGLSGCPPGFYRSAFVVRRGEGRAIPALLAEARVAVNGVDSQSGYGVWLDLGVPPARPLIIGSHARSLSAVARGLADLTAVDAVSLMLIRRTGGLPTGLWVAGWSAPHPGLPLITGEAGLVAPIRRALGRVVGAPGGQPPAGPGPAPPGIFRTSGRQGGGGTGLRATFPQLGLRGFVPLTGAVYAEAR